MNLLKKAITSQRCIISVIGDHACEGIDAIFKRKIADIDRVSITFWLMKSPKAKPPQVQEMCRTQPAYAIFVDPASKGGARPTIVQDAAKEYSENGKTWHLLPKGLSPVTGKIDTRTAALIFDVLTTYVHHPMLDLWDYADFTDTQKPIKLILGCSSICAIRKDMSVHPEKLKSRYRKIVAVARLVKPYCVWIR